MNANTEHGDIRELVATTAGTPASDGDGVKLTRIIGSQELNMLDPFLLPGVCALPFPGRRDAHACAL